MRNGKRAVSAAGSLQKARSFAQCSQRHLTGAAIFQFFGASGGVALRASRKPAAWRHSSAKAAASARPVSACSARSAAGRARSGVTARGWAATASAAVPASRVNPRRQASAKRSHTAASPMVAS